jgi:hypothetical protein
MKKVHGLDIKQLTDPAALKKEVFECIDNNSKS